MRSAIPLLSLLPWAALGAPLLDVRGAAPGKYIVILRPEVESAASVLRDMVDRATFKSIKEHQIYHHGDFKGFTASLSAKRVASLKKDPRVAYLEADGMAHIQTKVGKRDVESNAAWGLGRISHRENGNRDYLYDSTGAGTCAYTIDTGVADHPDFEGRATQIMSYTGVNTDDNGHGND